MARSAARRFSWKRLARTDSQATIHATLGTLYLRRLQRGDENDGKVDSDAAQDQGHEEQGRVRHQGRRHHPERLHRQGRPGRRSTGHATGGHIPAVSPGSLPGWGTGLGRRAGENEVKQPSLIPGLHQLVDQGGGVRGSSELRPRASGRRGLGHGPGGSARPVPATVSRRSPRPPPSGP